MELKQTKSEVYRTTRQPKINSKEETEIGTPLYNRRALQFARVLGFEHDRYEDLPDHARKAIECIGYDTFIKVLIKFDLANGYSLQQVANRYGVYRSLVQRQRR